jgi:hypothetical protein
MSSFSSAVSTTAAITLKIDLPEKVLPESGKYLYPQADLRKF